MAMVGELSPHSVGQDGTMQAPTLHDRQTGGEKKLWGIRTSNVHRSASCQTSDFRPATTNDHLLFFLHRDLNTNQTTTRANRLACARLAKEKTHHRPSLNPSI